MSLESCPIEKLRFYTDEKLSYCEKLSLHSVRCPKQPKIPISMLNESECEACLKEN